MSTTDDKHPAIQWSKAWFVVIHIVLVIFYIFHWEHRVILPFTPMNDDFWPVVLSASLQAFYTIYTAVLLFLTQRLAVSRMLVRNQTLTAIHDISGAWAGLGSALNGVRQQIDIPASWWMTSAVTIYLASISVLHVTSSTLLQLQTFNASMTTSVPTILAWPKNLSSLADSATYSPIYDVNWPAITASLPVINQLPGVVSAGLSNTTVYDTPQTNAIVGNATVNATTITSSCGLLPNISYSVDYTSSNPMIVANSSIGDEAFLCFRVYVPWSDQIQVISAAPITPSASVIGIVFVVSTLLDIDPSVQEMFAVPVPWEMNNSCVYFAAGILDAYFIQCSLSAVSAEAVLDMQTNTLQNPASTSQSSKQWGEVNQWISNDWQSQIGDALTTRSVGSGVTFSGGYEPSMADEFIMSLVGLNLTAEYDQYSLWGLPVPAVILSPDQLEAAIARVAAQIIWISGKIGLSNGGFQPGNGTAYVNEDIVGLRLNINILPLSFAISASAIMMALALSMTRAGNISSNSQVAIKSTGALQLLWLGHHSASVNEVLEDVEHPTEANLRRAGMINIRFAKTKISDQEELESFTDRPPLSDQVDYGCDDAM
ncbi:hypothetical protein BDR07DRAFT_1378752 [Suillus spraguei]|nr:hypothetical protein BDR07DRAFT_1378752 [Suillus spraguei]